MLVRTPKPPDRREREALEGTARRPAPGAGLDAAAVVALQRSAGNAAVARMLSRPVLQRSPGTWHAATAEIVKLKKGKARTSFWPAVIDRVSEYGQLRDEDDEARTATLYALETAIQAWQKNQESNLWLSDLDKQKHAAVDSLTKLIAGERRELRSRQTTSHAPTSTLPPLLVGHPTPAVTIVPTRTVPVPKRTAAVVPTTMVPTAPPPRASAFAPQPAKTQETKPSSLDDIFDLQIDATPEESEAEAALPKEEVRSEDLVYEEDPLPKERKHDPKFPATVHLRVHMTQADYLKSIHATGLFAGKEQGIGLANEREPEKRERDTKWLYALDVDAPVYSTIEAVGKESGGEPVGMVSAAQGDRDVNYPEGGAVRYPRQAPPVRGFGTEESTADAYSFPVPLTPRSRTALTAFVNRHTAKPMSEAEVAKVVEVALRRHMPLHVYRKFGRTKRKSAAETKTESTL
jgi:hypothetical protein